MTVSPRVHVTRRIILFALPCLLIGCSNWSPPPPSGSANSEPTPYLIGVSDVLRVTVWKHENLEVQAPVRSDGKISVPLLDDVQAAGLTPERLKNEISERLSPLLNNPDVTVIVLSADSQKATVTGAVLRSGQVSLTHEMGVLEAVAAAGGFNAWANKGDVRVIRSVDGKRVSYRFNYRAYVKGLPDSDIILKPGDVVVVPE